MVGSDRLFIKVQVAVKVRNQEHSLRVSNLLRTLNQVVNNFDLYHGNQHPIRLVLYEAGINQSTAHMVTLSISKQNEQGGQMYASLFFT